MLFAGPVPAYADAAGQADAYLFPTVDYLGADYTSIYQAGDQIRITLTGNSGGASTILTTSADSGEQDALALPAGDWTVARLDYLHNGQAQDVMTACPRSVSVESDSGMDFKIAVGAGAVWNDYQNTSNVFEGGQAVILSQAATADSESDTESAPSADNADAADAALSNSAEKTDSGTVIHGSSLLASDASSADSSVSETDSTSAAVPDDTSIWSAKNRLPLTIVLAAMLGGCAIALCVIRYQYKHRPLDDTEDDDLEEDNTDDDEGV